MKNDGKKEIVDDPKPPIDGNDSLESSRSGVIRNVRLSKNGDLRLQLKFSDSIYRVDRSSTSATDALISLLVAAAASAFEVQINRTRIVEPDGTEYWINSATALTQ